MLEKKYSIDDDQNIEKKILFQFSLMQEGPNTREYLQLALARVLELQRALNDDTYFDDETSDLGNYKKSYSPQKLKFNGIKKIF